MVLEILEVEDDVATVDTDGDGEADSEESRQAYGVTDQELHAFGTRYQRGQTLWRTRNSHFSDWDSNWNLFPALDAISPAAALAALNALGMLGGESKACGSIIGCENQTLGESLRLSGTPFRLHYQSERTLGRKDTRQVSIQHDAVNRTLYLGDGRARAAAALSDQITPVAGPGTTGVPDQSDASRRSSMRAVSGSSKSTRAAS